MKLNQYNIYFLKSKYDICNKNIHKRKKNYINDDYDKLFFNLLNIIKHSELDLFYNRHKEQNIKLNICCKLDDYKFKNKASICEKLSYEKNIDLTVLNVLCLFFKINVCYVCENIYIKMFYNTEIDNYFILNKDLSFKNIKHEKLLDIIENKYEITNINKPINSMSYYKVDELKELCYKLNISIEEKVKKSSLYNIVSKHICNMIPIF
tara:strand:+ start:91 stop:714 length:624 start_codon:yes stop_codon:yes gene_type:complete